MLQSLRHIYTVRQRYPRKVRPFMINSKIISFVATRNPASARKFYEQTLGLAFVSEDPFAIVFDVKGTMLRVQKGQGPAPGHHTVLGWEVQDIRAEIEALTKNRVPIERFNGLPQDELGI